MALEAGVKLVSDDFEMLMVGHNKPKHMMAIWSMAYDPQTFLCGTWANTRWHGILDMGHLKMDIYEELKLNVPICRVCQVSKSIYKTVTEPVWYFCSECFVQNRCACGKAARLQSKRTKLKICGEDCTSMAKNPTVSPYFKSNAKATIDLT
jgi:hypothetical protein